jgi:hypothetical protein
LFFIASAVLHQEALCRNTDFVLVVAGYYSLPVLPVVIKVQAPMKVLSTSLLALSKHYFCFQILLALFNCDTPLHT